ncbi:DUF5054 domain-containing protein [Microbacterium sp. NPDC057650]|uniref:DUF5054 domain-containing protein n=1 Tax=unclassified Microbacterium TaxID=2609290 RepID=UPI00366D7F1A
MAATIHVVFKTHLDVGFTALADTVIRRYLDSYLPKAMDLAEELERRGGRARFVWTTGSWMIHHALRTGEPDLRARLDAAIRRGDIRWHALPLTTHTELMDRSLAEYALSIAADLDARYGRRTTAAKMTDVPGHTIGLVPVLTAGGVDYLHIGVNGASAVPEVPEFFRWRAPEGSELVVHYARSYGAEGLDVTFTPDKRVGLHLAHTGDNLGPPSADEVEDLFQRLAAQHPDAEIVASGLDDFAAALVAQRAILPIVEDEIADSWIHGAGADPLLTAGLRALLALRRDWLASGELAAGTAEHDVFSEWLLRVVEHTWGEDLKTFLPDYVNYRKPDFAAARARDAIDPSQNPPATKAYDWAWAEHPSPQGLTYSGFEASWAEQRAHLNRALEALAPHRRTAAADALAALVPRSDAAPAVRTAEPGEILELGRFRVRFAEDGSIDLLDDEHGRSWAGPEHHLGAFSFQTFDERDEQLWMTQYCRDRENTDMWAVPDQSKPGLSIAGDLPASLFRPVVLGIDIVDGTDAGTATVRMTMPDSATTHWGAPRRVTAVFTFPHGSGAIDIRLDVAGRDASRLPEASWFAFRPLPATGAWSLDKLGTAVDPTRVVRGGNRSLHAVEAVRRSGEQALVLASADAPLVAVGEPQLLRFENRDAQPEDGFHVNLHNNVWGTNFRMWFDDDLSYRFTLDLAGSIR